MTRARPSFTTIDFRRRFPALDGIRGLAVAMVFAFHYGGGSQRGMLLRGVNAIRQRGWMGVDLFFVLSGFLITGILYDTRLDGHYFRRFFSRRALRIFPVFYLSFAVILLLTPLFQYQWRAGHLWFLVYLGNFALASDATLRVIASANHPAAAAHIEHLWTLFVEEQFYLLWPLVVWKVGDRLRLLRIAAVLAVMALALRTIYVHEIFPNFFWLMRTLPYRMDGLLTGAILALLLRGPRADLWQRICCKLFLPAAIAVFCISALSPAPDSPWLLTIGYSAVPLAAVGLISMALRPDSPAFRLLSLRPLRKLGRVSYGFYVYHLLWAGSWPLVTLFLAPRLHSQVLGNVIALSAAFAVTYAVSLLSYNLFEVRFLRLKRHFAYDLEATADARATAGRTILDKTRFQE